MQLEKRLQNDRTARSLSLYFRQMNITTQSGASHRDLPCNNLETSKTYIIECYKPTGGYIQIPSRNRMG